MNIKRVLGVFSAHGYGQIVTLISILAVPYILIRQWGAEGLGLWITISAICQFLLMADLGLSLSAPNALCMRGNDEWRLLANICFRKLLKNVFLVWFAFGLISFFLIYFEIVGGEFGEAAFFIYILLSLNAAIQPIIVFYSGCLRLLGKPGKGVLLVNHSRFLEVASIVFFAGIGLDIIGVAVAQLSVRVFFVLYVLYRMIVIIPRDEIGRGADNDLASIRSSGIGFVVIRSVQHVTIQAPVLILSFFMGPASAAVYALARTISRTALQPLSIWLASISHELTEYFSAGKAGEFKNVVRLTSVGSFVFVAICSFLLLVFLDDINKYWLANKVGLSKELMVPLILSALVVSQSTVFSHSLAAINRTKSQALIFLLSGLFTVLGVVFVCYLHAKIEYAAWVVFVAEILVLPVLIKGFVKVK